MHVYMHVSDVVVCPLFAAWIELLLSMNWGIVYKCVYCFIYYC